MAKQYAIEGAGERFAAAVEEAEHGARVEVTRGGKAVAVLLGLEGAEVQEPKAGDFWSAYEEVRRQFRFEELGINPEEVFADVREDSPGRGFSW